MAEARHSGTAWARHGHGMLCVNRPLLLLSVIGSLVADRRSLPAFSRYAYNYMPAAPGSSSHLLLTIRRTL